jgi:hypothetical protein
MSHTGQRSMNGGGDGHHSQSVDRRLRTASRRAHSPSTAPPSPAMHLQTNNRRVSPSQDEGFSSNPITTCQRATITLPQRTRETPPGLHSERKSGPKSADSIWVPSWIRRLFSSTFTDVSAISTTSSKSESPGETAWSLEIRPTEALSTSGETWAEVSWGKVSWVVTACH